MRSAGALRALRHVGPLFAEMRAGSRPRRATRRVLAAKPRRRDANDAEVAWAAYCAARLYSFAAAVSCKWGVIPG